MESFSKMHDTGVMGNPVDGGLSYFTNNVNQLLPDYGLSLLEIPDR